VIAAIEESIVSGAWPAGERLPAEPELAAQFGVSRSVIRDATRNLAARGLIEVRHGFGTTVAGPSTQAYADAILMLLLRSSATIGDLLDARAVIESGVVAAAARRRTLDDCAELVGHVDGMEAALAVGDWRSAFGEDLAFHQAVIRAARLPALATILEPLHHVIASSLLVPDVADAKLFNASEHRRIFEAIEEQNEESARQAMAAHFSSRDDPAFAALYSTRCADLVPLARQVRKAGAQPREPKLSDCPEAPCDAASTRF
jgi:DNA-binding FadR family transcriptional regulator